MKVSTQIYILTLCLALFFSGCSLSSTGGRNLNNDRLEGCPSSPNCVSSEAPDAKHAVAPLHLAGDPQKAWKAITKIVGQLPRSKIVENTERYLHVECKSRLFRFVDDLELLLDPAAMVISIRSAARVGKSDLGVNRRRVEALRKKLQENGLII